MLNSLGYGRQKRIYLEVNGVQNLKCCRIFKREGTDDGFHDSWEHLIEEVCVQVCFYIFLNMF